MTSNQAPATSITPTITSTAKIYGNVIDVDFENLTASIFTIQGERLHCHISPHALDNQGAINKLKQFNHIGIQGQATYMINGALFIMLEFRIDRVLHYERVPITKAFDELRKLGSRWVDDIKDVATYIHELRYGQER